ncbi:hypothetical protein MHYP_G00128990 [Metynnis hypsauchen]
MLNTIEECEREEDVSHQRAEEDDNGHESHKDGTKVMNSAPPGPAGCSTAMPLDHTSCSTIRPGSRSGEQLLYWFSILILCRLLDLFFIQCSFPVKLLCQFPVLIQCWCHVQLLCSLPKLAK